MAQILDWIIIPRADPTDKVVVPRYFHEHDLLNSTYMQTIKYGERSYGINLVWAEPSIAIHFQRESGTYEPLKFEELFAFSVRGGDWVKYGRRDNGINLVWSGEPVYEWKFTGGTAGSKVPTNTHVGLFNIHHEANDHVVYEQRSRGINLKWFREARNSGQNISVSSEGSGTSSLFVVKGNAFTPNSLVIIRAWDNMPFNFRDFRQSVGADGKFVSRIGIPCGSGVPLTFVAFEDSDPDHTNSNPFTTSCP